MAKKKRVPVATGPRNQLHDHPLMKKGGFHQQTTKAKRQADKVKLKKEWPDVSAISAFTSGHFSFSAWRLFGLKMPLADAGPLWPGTWLDRHPED